MARNGREQLPANPRVSQESSDTRPAPAGASTTPFMSIPAGVLPTFSPLGNARGWYVGGPIRLPPSIIAARQRSGEARPSPSTTTRHVAAFAHTGAGDGAVGNPVPLRVPLLLL